jgi:hypothetical protein
MDPAGQGVTQAGMIVGIIACVLMVIPIAIGILMVVARAAHMR